MCPCKWAKMEKKNPYFHTRYQQRENDGRLYIFSWGLDHYCLFWSVDGSHFNIASYWLWSLSGDLPVRFDSVHKPRGCRAFLSGFLRKCRYKLGHTSPKAMVSKTPFTQLSLLAWRDQASVTPFRYKYTDMKTNKRK